MLRYGQNKCKVKENATNMENTKERLKIILFNKSVYYKFLK